MKRKLYCILCTLAVVLGTGVLPAVSATTQICDVIGDTYLAEDDNETNFGSLDQIILSGGSDNSTVSRGISRFNLPAYVTASQVTNGILHFYALSDTQDLNVKIHPLTTPWTEKDISVPGEEDPVILGATWNFAGTRDYLSWSTPGGDFGPDEKVTAAIQQGWNTINITPLLVEQLDQIRRFGLLIALDNETQFVVQELSTREGAEAPYLELEVDLGIADNESMCPVVADTYIDNGGTSDPEKIDWNFNWKTRVLVSWHPTHGTARGLWKFEIPNALEASRVDNATLHLSGSEHALTFNQFVVDCYGLNEPFDEETDSWNSLAGGDYDSSVVSSGIIYQEINPEMTNWVAQIDVTNLLSGNLDKVRDNGILLRLQDEGTDRFHQNIASRESPDETDMPAYLKIRIGDEPPASTTTTSESAGGGGGGGGGGSGTTTTTAVSTTTSTAVTTTTIPESPDNETTTTTSAAPPPPETTTTTTEDSEKCFIREILGAEHTHELSVLLLFRDQRMVDSARGLALVYLYYAYGSEMIDFVASHPAIQIQIKTLLAKAVPQLEIGLQTGKDIIFTEADNRELHTLINSIRTLASPGLRDTLSYILGEMQYNKILKSMRIQIQ